MNIIKEITNEINDLKRYLKHPIIGELIGFKNILDNRKMKWKEITIKSSDLGESALKISVSFFNNLNKEYCLIKDSDFLFIIEKNNDFVLEFFIEEYYTNKSFFNNKTDINELNGRLGINKLYKYILSNNRHMNIINFDLKVFITKGFFFNIINSNRSYDYIIDINTISKYSILKIIKFRLNIKFKNYTEKLEIKRIKRSIKNILLINNNKEIRIFIYREKNIIETKYSNFENYYPDRRVLRLDNYVSENIYINNKKNSFIENLEIKNPIVFFKNKENEKYLKMLKLNE